MKPTTVTSANELAFQVAQQTEMMIVKQLDALISRGILRIVRTEPILVQSSSDMAKIEYKHGVKLELHNEEYVKELEAENERLKYRLEKINELLNRQDKWEPSGAV